MKVRTSTGWAIIFFVYFSWGCGGMDRPCQSEKDCFSGEVCKQGLCNDSDTKDEAKNAEKKEEASEPSEPSGESVKDGGAPEAEPTTEAMTEPILPEHIPAPCEGVKPPSCRVIGLCKDVKPRCDGGTWRCVYPPGFEEKEVTCDGQDNDCDGQVDEGIERPCYDGPAGTKGVGTCKAGTQRCEAGQWGVCKGQVLPQNAPHDPKAEIHCDGQDEDCDGQVDEGAARICYTGPDGTAGIGACRYGEKRCEGGKWGACVGEVVPQAEVCDGVDNNCDGQVDEGLVKRCYGGPAGSAGKGICKEGTSTCQGGQWGACVGEVLPQAEVCDGMDNNCDGQIDEGVTRSCYSGPAGSAGKGVCKAGVQACQGGQWGTCVGEVLPQAEKCDGMDNNCDGQIDESLVQVCYRGPLGTGGVGICKVGKSTCQNGQWGSCVGQVLPSTETCNGQDDNCDGRVDENLTRSCYSGPSWTSGQGICRGGTQTCQSGQWGSCVGQVLPKTETCNAVDDNCDGQIDNGSLCGSQKVCQGGACVCDSSKGYRPYNGGCIKDGDLCPAALAQSGQACLDNDKMLVCDPNGRVGIISCFGLMGTSCINYAGIQGCRAQAHMSSNTGWRCQKFVADYNRNYSWSATLGAYGVQGNAVVMISFCGSNSTGCVTVQFFAGGTVVGCRCGETSSNCAAGSGVSVAYNVGIWSRSTCQAVYDQNTPWNCPRPNGDIMSRYCTKTTDLDGFDRYACR